MSNTQLSFFAETEEWTYSKLKTLNRCPLEFKVRYIEKKNPLFQPVGIETWLGRVLHAVVAEYYRHFECSDPLERLAEIYSRKKPRKIEWETHALGQKHALDILAIFSKSELARRAPVAVELACSGLVGRIRLRGRIDLLCIPKKNINQISLIEFKLNDVEVKHNEAVNIYLQPLLYYHALPQDYRERIESFGVYVFESGELLEIPKSETLLREAVQRVSELVGLARRQVFPPKLNAFCSSCGYRSHCPEYQKATIKEDGESGRPF